VPYVSAAFSITRSIRRELAKFWYSTPHPGTVQANSFWIPGRDRRTIPLSPSWPKHRRCIPQADLVTLLSSREFSKRFELPRNMSWHSSVLKCGLIFPQPQKAVLLGLL